MWGFVSWITDWLKLPFKPSASRRLTKETDSMENEFNPDEAITDKGLRNLVDDILLSQSKSMKSIESQYIKASKKAQSEGGIVMKAESTELVSANQTAVSDTNWLSNENLLHQQLTDLNESVENFHETVAKGSYSRTDTLKAKLRITCGMQTIETKLIETERELIESMSQNVKCLFRYSSNRVQEKMMKAIAHMVESHSTFQRITEKCAKTFKFFNRHLFHKMTVPLESDMMQEVLKSTVHLTSSWKNTHVEVTHRLLSLLCTTLETIERDAQKFARSNPKDTERFASAKYEMLERVVILSKKITDNLEILYGSFSRILLHYISRFSDYLPFISESQRLDSQDSTEERTDKTDECKTATDDKRWRLLEIRRLIGLQAKFTEQIEQILRKNQKTSSSRNHGRSSPNVCSSPRKRSKQVTGQKDKKTPSSPLKIGDCDTCIFDTISNAHAENPGVKEMHISSAKRDISLDCLANIRLFDSLDSIRTIKISTDTGISQLEDLLEGLTIVCPKLLNLEISSKQQIQCCPVPSRISAQKRKASLKSLSLSGDCNFDLQLLLLLSAWSHPSLRKVEVDGGMIWIRFPKSLLWQYMATSIEVLRISEGHPQCEIDVQELLTLLSVSCPKLKHLYVEAERFLVDSSNADQEARMQLPSLTNLTFSVKNEMISEKRRIDLARMICLENTGGTMVRWKSRDYTWGNIGCSGGSLHVESYGFTLSVPKGALDKETFLSVKVLTDMPSDAHLSMGKNDMIIGYGFKCTPIGQTFKKTVTIQLPHCAILSGKSLDNVVLYWTENDQDFVRVPIGQDSDLATYHGKEGEIGIQLSHFCGGYVGQADPVAKRISLMCFISDQMPKNRKPILRVYLFDHLKGCQEDIRSDERSVYKDEQSSREVESGEILDIYNDIKDLHIECTLLNGRRCKSKPKIISGEALRNLVKRKEMFVLNLEKRPDDINFELSLKRVEERSLIYPTGYKSDYTSDDNDDDHDEDGNHGTPSTSQRGRKSNRKRKHNDVCRAGPSSESPSQTESSPRRSKRKKKISLNRGNSNDPLNEYDIHSLSEKLPGDRYDKLAIQLFPDDWGYNKGRNIKEGRTTPAAYRKLLHSWRSETENTTRGMLDDILKKSGLSGYIAVYYSKSMDETP